MGRAAQNTVVYVGLARLPQPLVAAAPTVALELEVDMSSGDIIAVQTNLPFPRLTRLLRDLLVGERVEACTNGALLELEVRYSAPFVPALRVALQSAAKRALADLARKSSSYTSYDCLAEREPLQAASAPALGMN
jgi:hypothetical protein